MSTKVNTLELYVNGSQVYPDTGLTADFSYLGYKPEIILQMQHNTDVLVDNLHRNLENVEVWVGWPVYYPILTQEQMDYLGNQGEPWNWRGLVYDFKNEIDLSAGFEGSGIQNSRCSEMHFVGSLPEDPDNPGYTDPRCQLLLNGNQALNTVTGLDLSDVVWQNINDGWDVPNNHNGRLGFHHFFYECFALGEGDGSFDITWPEHFTGLSHSYAFNHWDDLTDELAPNIDIEDPGTDKDSNQLYVDMSYAFRECWSITQAHITSSSYAYIETLQCTWENSHIKEIDLPATTNPDIRLECMVNTPTIQKIIIRASLNNIWDSNDPNKHLLANWWDLINDDPDNTFMQNFGGIYVPDNEISDWQDAQTSGENNEDWKTWIRSKVYGLSSL